MQPIYGSELAANADHLHKHAADAAVRSKSSPLLVVLFETAMKIKFVRTVGLVPIIVSLWEEDSIVDRETALKMESSMPRLVLFKFCFIVFLCVYKVFVCKCLYVKGYGKWVFLHTT